MSSVVIIKYRLQNTYGFLAPGKGNEEKPLWEGLGIFTFASGLEIGIPFPKLLGRGSSFLAANANPLKPKPLGLPGPPLLNIADLSEPRQLVRINILS